MERNYEGLADVAIATRELDVYGEEHVQLNYDTVNDRVWLDRLDSPSRKSAIVYDDKNIINCGILSHPSTRAEIRAQIEITLRELEIN